MRTTHTIRATRDYSIFVDVHGNRIIQQRITNRIKHSMMAAGNLQRHTPVIVTEDLPTGKLKVIDGQHRILALADTGQPVWYSMLDEGEVSDYGIIPILNSAQTPWSLTDYIHWYASRDDEVGEEYRNLENMIEYWGDLLPPSTIIKVLYGFNPKYRDVVISGKHQHHVTPWTGKILKTVRRIFESNPGMYGFVKHKGFVGALTWLVHNRSEEAMKDFSFERLVEQVLRHGGLVMCATRAEYIRQIEIIYNIGASERAYLRLM